MSAPLNVRVQLLAGAWLDLDNAPAAVSYVATLDEPGARAAFDACCEILRRTLDARAAVLPPELCCDCHHAYPCSPSATYHVKRQSPCERRGP